MATHLAAVSLAKGVPFELRSRLTPEPGPNELLIQVRSVALNPADHLMRDTGLMIATYPTVTGFDLSGLVLEVSDEVPISAVNGSGGPHFRPGITRVAAYAAFIWHVGDLDYGALQERCLVPWQHAVPIPDECISWNEAAILPVAVEVALNAWDIMGVPHLEEAVAPSSAVSTAAIVGAGASGEDAGKNVKQKREALLIWGASSSVGTMGVQTARVLREDCNSAFVAVYATVGTANQKYVDSLGADRVFDYKDPKVVDANVSAAELDHVVIRHCFLAVGQLAPCRAVLKAFLEINRTTEKRTAKIATAPPILPEAQELEGMEIIFVLPSMTNEEERLAQFRNWLGTYLRKNLAMKIIWPSPEPTVVGKGLEAVNAGLDMLRQGVSCTKLVVEIME